MEVVLVFNAFEIFNVPEVFNLDENELEKKYVVLSKENHPDMFGINDERVAAAKRMETINKAHKILKSKLARADHLMSMKSYSPDQKVVGAVLSIVESGELEDPRELIDSCIEDFSGFFGNGNYESAANVLFKWKFIEKLFNEGRR